MQRVSFVTNKVVRRLGLATGLSCEFKSRANCLAKLEDFSYSATTGMTLQLPCVLYMCASFSDLPTASQSRGLAELHTFELFFTLSHTLPLHDSHLNTGFLNAKLQANWHGIKPTKWLIKFNLTIPRYSRKDLTKATRDTIQKQAN